MPEPYSRQSPENKYDRQRSPSFVNNDRYTPVALEKPRTQRPEVFYMQTKHDNKSMDDQPSYEPSSSPPINTFQPSPNARPEFYHMKTVDNDNENIVYDRRSSPALMSNNRVSPAPYHKPDGQGIEMYHIKGGDNINRQSPPPPIHDNHQTPLFNNSTNFHDDHDPHKITTYLLTTTDGENRPPSSHIQRRTPSPPIRPIKKQTISYDIVDDDHKYDVPVKQRPFPTALHDVPTHVRHLPLSHSKASESIRRSMDKYRFAGS